MKRFSIGLLLVLGMVGCPWQAFAERYTEVTYQGGHPDWDQTGIQGSLRIDDEGITYTTRQGDGFTIPYTHFAGYKWQSKSLGSSYPLAVAGPHPALLASTLGYSLFRWGHAKTHPKMECFYRLEFQDNQGVRHTVTFQVPKEAQLTEMAADTDRHLDVFQATQRRYLEAQQQYLEQQRQAMLQASPPDTVAEEGQALP